MWTFDQIIILDLSKIQKCAIPVIMNRISLIIFASLLNFYFIESSYAFRILIDPGHGGSDRGAVRGKAIESQLAFDVAEKLVAKLKTTAGINVSQTRDADTTTQLKDRVKISDAVGADLFISIHINSSEDIKARGTEFYFATSQGRENDDVVSANTKEKIINDYHHLRKLYQSKQLAENIADQNSKNMILAPQRRKILQAPFYVVNKTKVPSLLIELGFLTNPDEANLLSSNSFQDELATEIYQGIMNYIQIQ